jgi:hypothetical protein
LEVVLSREAEVTREIDRELELDHRGQICVTDARG